MLRYTFDSEKRNYRRYGLSSMEEPIFLKNNWFSKELIFFKKNFGHMSEGERHYVFFGFLHFQAPLEGKKIALIAEFLMKGRNHKAIGFPRELTKQMDVEKFMETWGDKEDNYRRVNILFKRLEILSKRRHIAFKFKEYNSEITGKPLSKLLIYKLLVRELYVPENKSGLTLKEVWSFKNKKELERYYAVDEL